MVILNKFTFNSLLLFQIFIYFLIKTKNQGKSKHQKTEISRLSQRDLINDGKCAINI